jgi:tetratricopeptide (TPR) repeat protein
VAAQARRTSLRFVGAFVGVALLVLGVTAYQLARGRIKRSDSVIQAASQQLAAADYAAALSTLSQAQAVESTDWRLYALRAFIHKQQGSWKEAVTDLTAALKLTESSNQPDTLGLLRDRAFAYRNLGDWERSIVDLTDALGLAVRARDSGAAMAIRRDRAYAYCQVRDVELALADYDALPAGAPGALDAKGRASLQAVVTLKTDVPFFAITTVGRIDQNDARVLPRPIQLLQPRQVDFINVRFWWYPITFAELRYTVPSDKELAQHIVDALKSNQFQVGGPTLIAPNTARGRRIELWFPRP